MFAFYANLRREIRSMNKLVFAVFFAFTAAAFIMSHILGGGSELYRCLRLPLLAAPVWLFRFLVFAIALCSSLAASLYMNRFTRVALKRKITASVLYFLFVTVCACWYPVFFAKGYFGCALFLLGVCIALAVCCIKVFKRKCGLSSILMFFTLILLVYLFFLQLCINILN